MPALGEPYYMDGVGSRETERDLIQRLFERHGRLVYQVALRFTGSRAEAEDVLQEVFLGLPRALRSYSEQGKLDAWLRRVTTRVALSRIRQRARRAEAPLEVAPVLVAGSARSPLDAIAVRNAIAALPHKLRIVFELKEIDGYSHAEIAEMLRIRPTTSRVRLNRAYGRLRTMLQE